MAHGSSGAWWRWVVFGLSAASVGCQTVDKNDGLSRLDPGVRKVAGPGGAAPAGATFASNQTGGSGVSVGNAFNRRDVAAAPTSGGLPAPQLASTAGSSVARGGLPPVQPTDVARTIPTSPTSQMAPSTLPPVDGGGTVQTNYQSPVRPAPLSPIKDPMPPVGELTMPEPPASMQSLPTAPTAIPPLPASPELTVTPKPTELLPLPSAADKPPLAGPVPSPPIGNSAPPVMPLPR